MKKILLTALCLLIPTLLFCSCSRGDGTEPIRDALEYPIVLTAETGELAFEMTLHSHGVIDVKMSAPRTLSGLLITKDGDNVTASYKGLTVPLPEASAKKALMLADIMDSVAASLENNTYVVENGSENSSLSAVCGDSVCIITYDKDGVITSAEINCGGKRTVYNITVDSKSNVSKETTSDVEKSG